MLYQNPHAITANSLNYKYNVIAAVVYRCLLITDFWLELKMIVVPWYLDMYVTWPLDFWHIYTYRENH